VPYRRIKFAISSSDEFWFIFTIEINSKSFLWPVQSVRTRNVGLLQYFRTRRMRVNNKTDNADITQSQAANHHPLLSHVTLGLVECRKWTACVQIADRFEPNTVFWAFHTIQP